MGLGWMGEERRGEGGVVQAEILYNEKMELRLDGMHE